MEVRLLIPIAIAMALFTALAPAQGCFLDTTLNRNNAQSSFMFDVVCTNPAGVDVTGFVVHLKPGVHDIEIYERTGTHVGNELSSAGWNLMGAVGNVVSAGNDLPTEVNFIPATGTFALPSVSIAGGATHAFYVVATNGPNLWGIQGTGTGNLWVSSLDLDFLEGTAGAVFGANTNIVWNGVIRYNVTGTAPVYQTNRYGAFLSIDNTIGYTCSPAITTSSVVTCGAGQNAEGGVTLGTNVSGQAWELVTTAAAINPGLPLGSPGLLNLSLAASWSYVNGGGTLAFAPYPAGFPGAIGSSFTINYSFAAATGVTAQGVMTDPTVSGGLSLTQPARLDVNVVASTSSVPGPVGDDTRVTVDFASAPNCWGPATGFPFYGTLFTQFHVESNGRVLFGPPPGSLFFTLATAADLLGGAGSIGMWNDLNPSPQTGAGVITITYAAPVISIDYVGVQLFGETGVNATYQVQLDTSPGNETIAINGLLGVPLDPEIGQVDDGWLGISPGATAGGGLPASDPGIVNGTDPNTALPVTGFFDNLGVMSPSTANPRDMLYDYYVGLGGVPGQLQSVVTNLVNSVIFFPDVTNNNYTWIATP